MNSLNPANMKVAKAILVSLMLVLAYCFIARVAFADGPPEQVLSNLEQIEANQKVLAETREAHEAFLKAKAENEQLERQNNDLGWRTDWSSMNPIPLAPAVTASSATQKLAPAASSTAKSGLAEYVWKGAPAYKNDRLRAYQQMLAERGITNKDHVKLLVAQLIQEAGSLSETTIGDGGCSVGILQYNACVHHGMNAKRFLQKHPAWKSWEYQLEQMANMVADRYEIYDGNIKQVVVHHNGPVFAKRGTDTPAGYFRAVSSRTNLLTGL